VNTGQLPAWVNLPGENEAARAFISLTTRVRLVFLLSHSVVLHSRVVVLVFLLCCVVSILSCLCDLFQRCSTSLYTFCMLPR
jgi:hypothetical protein